MEFISFLQDTLSNQLPQIIAAYEGDLSASSLSEMESAIQRVCHTLGGELLEQWLAAQTPHYPEDAVSCPHCGGAAGYVRWREAMSITLLGRVHYRRPYYGCPDCHQGHAPFDQALQIAPGEMSTGVVQVAALVGVQTSFAHSRDLLLRTAQIDLSANSIRKACQRVGAAVIQQEDDWQAASQDLEGQRQHQRQTDKPRQMYGSLDGFMSHMEGAWHEMKVGAWWTTRPQADGSLSAEQISYYTDGQAAAEFSELTWATGFQRLADQAEEIIFVADGAEWIWRIVQQHFPQAVQIVDWYHALSYVREVAQAAFADEQTREVWVEQQRSHLWQGRRAAVFRACRQCAPHAPEVVRRVLAYFTHQRRRLRYDRFRAAGYQIGSGTMESGCKQLGVGRLNIAGAQWSARGARLVAKARAAYLSGQWDELNLLSCPLPHVA